MEKENKIVKDVVDKFKLAEGKYTIVRDRRITFDVNMDNYLGIIEFLKNKSNFDFICTITGIDAVTNYEAIYHFANSEGILLNVKLVIPKDKPVIKSITPIYEGAVYYERELIDMFGIQVEGLPEGRHYPLPDCWPKDQYPLRKDWKPTVNLPS
jgi:NADH:ubiquinone oxidoreductase subunit C